MAAIQDYLYTLETLGVGYHVLYTRTCWTEYDTNGFLSRKQVRCVCLYLLWLG